MEKGYSQTEGIDYQEIFSPVVKMVTVRSIIDIVAAEGWIIYQMYIFNGFIQGDLFEEVYIELPKGFISQGGPKVCKLIKTLYGLKHMILGNGMQNYRCIFIFRIYPKSTRPLIVYQEKGVSIGDCISICCDLSLTGNGHSLIQELKRFLHLHFNIKDFRGIEIHS